ncbi:SubName: Full=Uncharacterized protein {ECO:0000313/EMBL:CCA66350.1} [Serendipita indica DSM 11827]|nr:SubName: Full=Uncharacterized protein {ECO:0000313/EMBL:CCA66350.1} [Serendipita indica DSM 11827]
MSPTEELTNNANGTEHSGTSSVNGRGSKRVRDDPEEAVEEKRPRGTKKMSRMVDESDMAVDGEGDGEEDSGDTRCVCGKSVADAGLDDAADDSDGDEGGLMVMCETCKVWQHTICMDIPDNAVPDHYYCELCEPDLHTELLKKLAKSQRRPRRRSSATRTFQKAQSASPSPQPMTTNSKVYKRRNTMNSRATTYEEEIALAIQASRMGATDPEEDEDTPPVTAGPRNKRRKRSPTSVPEPEPSNPPTKHSRSASVTSEHPPPVRDATPNPPAVEVAEQPAPEPSDEEVAAPPPPPTRGKRGGGPRKGTRKVPTPGILDDNDEAPGRASTRGGRQPNQYSRRGGHAKRGGGHHGMNESNKRLNNLVNNKASRPASPPPFLTTWHLPDHLSHLQDYLPSEIPEPLDVRTGAGSETTQERGIKVKWPTKRMTIGDMNKRVRNILEYVTREQANHVERQTRVAALDEAIASGRYRPLTPEPSDLMDVDALPLAMEEDVKPKIPNEVDGAKSSLEVTANGRSVVTDAVSDNPTVAWMKKSTDDMLADLVSDLIKFQDQYRPRSRRHAGIVA